MNSQKRKWKENIEMILQTNDHVTFLKSIIRNASDEGRCVNEIESEEIANSLKAVSYTHLDVYKRQVLICL